MILDKNVWIFPPKRQGFFGGLIGRKGFYFLMQIEWSFCFWVGGGGRVTRNPQQILFSGRGEGKLMSGANSCCSQEWTGKNRSKLQNSISKTEIHLCFSFSCWACKEHRSSSVRCHTFPAYLCPTQASPCLHRAVCESGHAHMTGRISC